MCTEMHIQKGDAVGPHLAHERARVARELARRALPRRLAHQALVGCARKRDHGLRMNGAGTHAMQGTVPLVGVLN